MKTGLPQQMFAAALFRVMAFTTTVTRAADTKPNVVFIFFLGVFPFKAIGEYETSLKKYPNPPVPKLMNFRGD